MKRGIVLLHCFPEDFPSISFREKKKKERKERERERKLNLKLCVVFFLNRNEKKKVVSSEAG